MTVNIFVVTTVANEYVQLAWNSLLGTSNLTAFTAVNGIPAIPSIIVTVEQVS